MSEDAYQENEPMQNASSGDEKSAAASNHDSQSEQVATPSDSESETENGPINELERPKKHGLVKKLAIAVGAVLVALVVLSVLGNTVLAHPRDLDASISYQGVSLKYPSSWSAQDYDGHPQIYTTSSPTGVVAIDTYDLDSATNISNEDSLRADLRTAWSVSDYPDLSYEDCTVDDCVAEKFTFTMEMNGSDCQAYALNVCIGTKCCLILAAAPSTEQIDVLTMKEVINSVSVDVTTYKASFVDEQGTSLGDEDVYDYGEGASLVLPSSFDEKGLLVTSWTCDDSSVTINENAATNITKDVSFIAATAKCWTVTFTDGDGKVLSTVKVQDGSAAQAPSDPTKSDYLFVGWDSDFTSVTGDLTVNATWKEKPKTYTSGTYKVGTDIPAGEYAVTASGSCYWNVYGDSTKSDLLGNDFFSGRSYVTLSDGQIFTVNDGSFCLASEAVPKSDIESSSGTFKVGFDIPAGEYKITSNAGTSGYLSVHNSSNPGARIVSNDFFEGQTYITVSDGQYLSLEDCTGSLS